MKYPTKEVYEILYKRFFDRDAAELISLVDGIGPGKRVLDLCCGTGRLALELAKKKCSVTAVDSCEAMFRKYGEYSSISFHEISVENFLVRASIGGKLDGEFDAVFCQQGINYWFNNVYTWQLARIFRTDGFFVFNTFKDIPSRDPVVKKYEIDGKKYVEVYYAIDNVVHHMQACTGIPLHITEFEYIPKHEFMKKLLPYFDVEVATKGQTLIFRCVRLDTEAKRNE